MRIWRIQNGCSPLETCKKTFNLQSWLRFLLKTYQFLVITEINLMRPTIFYLNENVTLLTNPEKCLSMSFLIFIRNKNVKDIKPAKLTICGGALLY